MKPDVNWHNKWLSKDNNKKKKHLSQQERLSWGVATIVGLCLLVISSLQSYTGIAIKLACLFIGCVVLCAVILVLDVRLNKPSKRTPEFK